MAVVPTAETTISSLLPLPFLFLLLACVVGLLHPYVPKMKRKHFALGAVASIAGIAATLPEPTPEQLAAQKAEEALAVHVEVVEKAKPALAFPPNYTRAEDGATYTRVGDATFEVLNELESGAAYAAAESTACDRVNTAIVSDTSKPSAAIWFVDCANEHRFVVSQKEAEQALARFSEGRLAPRERSANCTLASVEECTMTAEQRAAKTEEVEFLQAVRDKEIEYVTACDLILEQVVVSPSSLDMRRWTYDLADEGKVVIERPFDSQNGFGAMLRSSYRCEIDGRTSNIEGFTVRGALGNRKFI